MRKSRSLVRLKSDVFGPAIAARAAAFRDIESGRGPTAGFGKGYEMELDWRVCSRARLARDARFDGKFYIGVHSTRIYCRPICHARASREENVCYFSTAAAAAAAGFRPCLRCRPECSPGTPAWAGTKTTVARALRLLNESSLEEGGVEALADHLGVGSRHLRRLFLRHLGATPRDIAQTRRLHFAKKLIDETRLPMTQIALASGFGTVRRFNAAIRAVYDRTPTQIRALARQKPSDAENQYEFRLVFRRPYSWSYMLKFLAAHAARGIEAIEGGCYRRTISVKGSEGFLEVSADEPRDELRVRVQIDDPGLLFAIIERVRAMFDLDADWSIIEKTLKADPLLAALLMADPGRRIAGCFDAFELTVRAILRRRTRPPKLAAQLNGIIETFGRPYSPAKHLTHLFPTPQALCDADLESLRVPRTHADSIRAVARAACLGRIAFDKIADTADFLHALAGCPGVGAQTIEYVAMRALRDTDAFPMSSSELKRVLEAGDPLALQPRALSWRPWRAYAAVYLSPSLGEH
ncbi:MAG TPA: AlkA N-terminal domain-containing protein [Steroidobacteraceae bacterium]|nr:AlkA N-terminal domain-containing protein [Steroidobacteraceae bacterium]